MRASPEGLNQGAIHWYIMPPKVKRRPLVLVTRVLGVNMLDVSLSLRARRGLGFLLVWSFLYILPMYLEAPYTF